jgi:hypothetical protein
MAGAVAGHLRKAATHLALKQFSDARRCYEKVRSESRLPKSTTPMDPPPI